MCEHPKLDSSVVEFLRTPISSIYARAMVIEDFRSNRGKRHSLADILVILVLAFLCFCDDADTIASWAESEEEWLKELLALPFGIPSEDTFLRVLKGLDPEVLEGFFAQWTEDFLHSPPKHIAFDGKTIAGTTKHKSGSKNRVHTVTAFACDQMLAMRQVFEQEKGGELCAALRLLKLFDLKGAVVTTDAGFCNRKLADGIKERQGEYCFQVKRNQKTILKHCMEMEQAHSEGENIIGVEVGVFETTEQNKGRTEKRTVRVFTGTNPLPLHKDWQDIFSVIVVESWRKEHIKGKESEGKRYYISSTKFEPKPAAEIIRAHWSIENALHFTLDVTFGEDACRLREKRLAKNTTLIRRFATNILKLYKDKLSVRQRRFKALTNKQYRMELLANALKSR